jgi:hypothetical protein
MCYAAAIPIVTLIISAAATAYSVDQQNQTVKTEKEARKQGQESAAQSFRNQSSDVNRSLQQQEEATINAKVENAKRAAEARATARTSSGQAGVAGLSVDNLLADFYRQEATYRQVTDTNFSYTVDQSQRELQGLRAGTTSRLNALNPAPVPGYLGAGLQIVGQGVQAYDQYQRNTDPNYANPKRTTDA